MAAKRLPASISEVKVPTFFSPSTIRRIEDCPQRVFSCSGSFERLPPHHKAIWGDLKHFTRFQKKSDENASKFEELFENLLKQIGEIYGEHKRSAFMSIIGRGDKSDATPQDGLVYGVSQFQLSDGNNKSHEQSHPDKFSFGRERIFVSNDLRLKGRMDFSELNQDSGVATITEYKTGKIFDKEGIVDPYTSTQVSMYALATLSHHRVGRVECLIDHNRELVRLSDTIIDKAEPYLKKIKQKYIAGKVIKSDVASKLGDSCRGCDIRHACDKYISSLKNNKPKSVASYAWDLMGILENVSKSRWNSDTQDLDIRQASGQLILVKGVSVKHGITAGNIDEEIYCFSLKPQSRVKQGHEPTNLYEFSEEHSEAAFQASFFLKET